MTMMKAQGPLKAADCWPAVSNVPVILPVHVIARQIGSYLDRRSLNNLRLTSRDVHQSMVGMEMPWPHTKLQVGSKLLGAQSVVFSPDGRSLACRSRGGTLQIWDQVRGKQAEWSSKSPFCFGNLTFSPDGRYLACDGSAKTIRMYEVSTGRIFGTFRGHQGSITSISFSPTDCRLLASGSNDSTVRLWDISTQTEQAVLQGNSGAIYSIAVSQDGQLLASGGVDQILRVWSLEKVSTNNPHNFCQNLEGHGMAIVEVAFSSQLLVSASLDRTIRIWSKTWSRGDRRKRRIAPLSFSCQRVLSLGVEALTVRFSHGSRNCLAVGLSNETVAIWNVDDLSAGQDSSTEEEENSRLTPALPIAVIPGKHFCLSQGVIAITSGKDMQLLGDDFSPRL